MTYHAVFRGGCVHVLSEQCSTCIFRGGNPMYLERGRVKGMVEECLANDTIIPCHKTIYEPDIEPAICRGFYDAYGDRITALQLAGRMDVIEFDA